MAHVFFFSYAHVNLNTDLREFFELLSELVADGTEWAPQDANISFRDGKDLALMDNWRPELFEALQTSAVLVSVTSPAYFQSKFSGQEYRVFDQRRRQQTGENPPPEVILPVIWRPITQNLPFVREIQLDEDGMSPLYRKEGLRHLKRLDPREYERCVWRFAKAIVNAWQQHPAIPRLKDVPPFPEIPNAFAGGQWEEAIDKDGHWIKGPSVANFVFAAAQDTELKQPQGRYGERSAEWRPYLPPESRTIADIAKGVAQKRQLKYREIGVDGNLAGELEATRKRNNLTFVLADPQTLPIEKYKPIESFDKDPASGGSLMLLWDGLVGPWETDSLQKTIKERFPVKSQLSSPFFNAPIRTAQELEDRLDVTLTNLLGSMTRDQSRGKDKTDTAPVQIVSVPVAPS